MAAMAVSVVVWPRLDGYAGHHRIQLLYASAAPVIATLAFLGWLARCIWQDDSRARAAALVCLWITVGEWLQIIGAATRPPALEGADPIVSDLWLVFGRAGFAFLLFQTCRVGLRRDDAHSHFGSRIAVVAASAAILSWSSRLFPANTALSFLLVEKVHLATLLPLILHVAALRSLIAAGRPWRDCRQAALLLTVLLAAASQIVAAFGMRGPNAPRFFADVLWIGALSAPILALAIEDVRDVGRSLMARLRALTALVIVIVVIGCWLLAARWPDPSKWSDRVDFWPRLIAFFAFVILAHAAAVALATFWSSSFSAKLRTLIDATTRFKNGRLDHRILVAGRDELALLGHAFNAMAERLSLQNNELKLLAEVLEGSRDPIVIVDLDHRVEFVNRAFLHMTGLSRNEVIGRPYDALFVTKSDSGTLTSIWNELDAERPWTGDVVTRSSDGVGVETDLSISSVVDEGKVRHFIAVHRDLRQSKDLERERAAYNTNLLRIHQIAQRLIDSQTLAEAARRTAVGIAKNFKAACRIWLLDTPRATPGTASDVPAAKQLRLLAASGTTQEPVPLWLALGDGCAGRAAETRTRIVCDDDAGTCTIDPDAARSDARGVWHVGFPFNVDGRFAGVFEVISAESARGRFLETMQLLSEIFSATASSADLHARVAGQADQLAGLTARLEQSLSKQNIAMSDLEVANRKLIAADNAKSQFLATTSHELRTPLSSIMGFLQLILDGLASNPEEERDFILEAYKCAKHLLNIINDVLDLAKIEAGRLQVVPSRVEVSRLFGDVDSVTRVQSDAKKLVLTFEAEESLLVYADYGRLKQVLINLVGNAVKFTDSGSVRVCARPLEDGHNVEFSVKDTGIGVDPVVQKKLFESFVQADSGHSRRYGGSGLGLAITQNLVTMMGGKVRLESEGLGKGTTLTFTLPVFRDEEFKPGVDVGADAPAVEGNESKVPVLEPTRTE